MDKQQPHRTEDDYCCACEFDLALIEMKIKEAQEIKVKEIITRLNIILTDPDDYLRGNLEDFIRELIK